MFKEIAKDIKIIQDMWNKNYLDCKIILPD